MANVNDTITTLLNLDQLISKYCLGLSLTLGIVSITFNTIIFTRKTFHNTSCILYLLSSTIANYPIVLFVIPCRLLADGFHIDPTQTSLIFCKFREYTLTVSRSLSAWFIVLASFDRLMSTSRQVYYRQFAHVRIARYTIVGTTLFGLLFYLPIPILFSIHIQNDQCEAPTNTYRITNAFLYSICYVIIPSIFMLLFGLSTVNNGKRQRRIAPITSSLNAIKRDRNLFLMIFFQTILFTCTTLPHGGFKIYTTITYDDMNYDVYQTVLTAFLTHLARIVSFINHSCQFYIFTLSSKLFREELRKFLYQVVGIRYKRHQQQVTVLRIENHEH
ncbi:hypothetical protein I4U23_019305 [Adineta vaga]|nr:hypothetical protein I4U23_019305 [Adineta vaga]